MQSLDAQRVPPAWESADRSQKAAGFFRTTAAIIFRPKNFYRTFTVRGPLDAAWGFARLHWYITSALFGIAGATHAIWFSYHIANNSAFIGVPVAVFPVLVVVFTLLTYFTLLVTTLIAARLTTWEATYRGLRLPYEIVLRGMYYHAAHYLPVALVAMAVVEGYQILLQIVPYGLPIESALIYLYVLCALVVLSAIYLFQTYWIGMRNMMYANR